MSRLQTIFIPTNINCIDLLYIEITDLKTITVYAYSGLEKHNQELNSLKEEVMNLKRRNIKLEAYTRRENIKIFGIEDERGESNTRT